MFCRLAQIIDSWWLSVRTRSQGSQASWMGAMDIWCCRPAAQLVQPVEKPPAPLRLCWRVKLRSGRGLEWESSCTSNCWRSLSVRPPSGTPPDPPEDSLTVGSFSGLLPSSFSLPSSAVFFGSVRIMLARSSSDWSLSCCSSSVRMPFWVKEKSMTSRVASSWSSLIVVANSARAKVLMHWSFQSFQHYEMVNHQPSPPCTFRSPHTT